MGNPLEPNQLEPSQNDSHAVEINPILPTPDSGDLALTEKGDQSLANPEQISSPVTTKRTKTWIIWLGAIVAVLWSAAALAYVAGMTGVSQLTALPAAQLAGLAFGTLGPAIFIFVLGWAIREIVLFAGAAARIQSLAERFADPAKATTKDARAMTNAVQTQMSQINKSVEGALMRLGAMEEVLRHHSDSFRDTERETRERTDTLINDLRREREAVSDLADQLDHKTADIASTIAEQSKMVVSAADIANAQSIDASKMLSSAIEKLEQSASNAVSSATRIETRLGRSTTGLHQTSHAIEDASKQLDATSANLETSQSRTNAALQIRKNEIAELLEITKQYSGQLETVANDGAKNMKQALEETLDQARHYTAIMREESRSLADNHNSKSKQLQSAADEARLALDTYAETIAKRLEHANEASFSAASWADKTFEKLQEATNALDNKLQALPETANASAQEIEKVLRQRLNDLNQASRVASNEARGIDQAFQSRIRQNYELLSEFMLKIGATASPFNSEVEIPNPLQLPLEKIDPAPVKLANPEPENHKPEKSNPEKPNVTSTKSETSEPINKDGWRWKDVLSRIDRSESKTASTEPADTALDNLVAVFQELQIQPGQLFDATSFRAAALARITDGHKAMTDVVRVDAAKAVELLAARFTKDPSLRLSAEIFTQELRQKVEQAANSRQKVHLETHLRTGDGPAFLLLEAALLG